MLISDEYREQNTLLHTQMAEYGKGGIAWTKAILRLAHKTNSKSLLDYGCGKGKLVKHLKPYWRSQIKAEGYDPCIEKYAKLPKPVDLVICMDVLEHVEPECIHDVLKHIQFLTKKVFFAHIVLRESGKVLPDGRNTHILVRSFDWWKDILEPYFPNGILINTRRRMDRVNFTWIK